MKFSSINFQGANECEHMNLGALDVPLSSKWLTIYYGNSYIPDRDLRIIHFCLPSSTIAQVENRFVKQLTILSLALVLLGMDGTIISVWTQSTPSKSIEFRLPGKNSLKNHQWSSR